MDLSLTDRVYLVTGGSRGLGRATVDCLVAEGARVVVSGRSEDTLLGVRAAHGDRVRTLMADNADPVTAARLVATARDTWGRLDGALVSVGGPPQGGVSEVTDQQWTAAFESVFLGAVRVAREVAAALEEGGSLAFVLSTTVRQPAGHLAISNGLRPGLAMVAKAMADEHGPRGVRVNGLLPGAVFTDRLRELTGLDDDGHAEAPHGIPLRRYGRPEEFGRVAAFLLSPAASYLTGVMLPVDGGATRSL